MFVKILENIFGNVLKIENEKKLFSMYVILSKMSCVTFSSSKQLPSLSFPTISPLNLSPFPTIFSSLLLACYHL